MGAVIVRYTSCFGFTLEIITLLLLINPSACHFAATPKEYAVTFSTIKSSGSVQN